MFCPEGHGIYVEKRHDYVQCPTCEVERLRAALEEAEPWVGVGPGGPDSQTRMRAVRERVRAALAEEVTPIHTDP
jgi:hypothetical protein